MKVAFSAALALAIVAGSPAGAQKLGGDGQPVPVNAEAGGVPVFPYDITDRAYEVVGPVKAEVRKGTIFSKEASQGKVYHELWERAQKLNADAVINAAYGDARVTLMSWGSIKATGTAIRFKAASAATVAAPTGN